MPRRTLLLAVPLGALVVVAGVALAAPGSAEQTSDAKLDKLHAVRPIAASPDVFGAAPAVAALHEAFSFVADVQAAEVGEFLAAVAARRASTAARRSSGDPLACIRQRESHGDYTVRSANGLYHGAYQFLQGTWDATAASAGRHDLVGADPAAASPDDQDAMAAALYARRGSQPWGGTC